jgi:hypothetical protein
LVSLGCGSGDSDQEWRGEALGEGRCVGRCVGADVELVRAGRTVVDERVVALVVRRPDVAEDVDVWSGAS